MAKSKSKEPVIVFRSSFLALTMARFISIKRADVPGNGSDSKFVPDRNLYRIVDDIMLCNDLYPMMILLPSLVRHDLLSFATLSFFWILSFEF